MTTLVDINAAKAHLNLIGADNDDLVGTYAVAAQSWLESKLGYTIIERYPNVPGALIHAVLLMTGHFYANREASIVGTGASELPLGVCDIINDYRDWSWSDVDE